MMFRQIFDAATSLFRRLSGCAFTGQACCPGSIPNKYGDRNGRRYFSREFIVGRHRLKAAILKLTGKTLPARFMVWPMRCRFNPAC